VRFFDLHQIDLDTEPGRCGTCNQTCSTSAAHGQSLAVLPDPMRVDRVTRPGAAPRHVREHRQRDVEVIVGMRAPTSGPSRGSICATPHRAARVQKLDRPRDVDRMQLDAWPIWPPVVAIMSSPSQSGRRRRTRPVSRDPNSHSHHRRGPRIARNFPLPRHSLTASSNTRRRSIQRDTGTGKRSASAMAASISTSPANTPPSA